MNISAINRNDLGALAAGGVTLLLSLFPAYVRVSVDSGTVIGSISSGTNAWESYAVLGMLLVLAATAIIALKVFAAHVLPNGAPWALVAAGAAGLGALLLILRALTATESLSGVDVGPGWSGWLIFISSIALVVFAVLRFRESGEKIPGQDDAGTTPAP